MDLKIIRRKTYPGTNTLLPESPIHHSSFETVDVWEAFYHLTIKINSIMTFYIHGSVNRESILIKSNDRQQYAADYLL